MGGAHTAPLHGLGARAAPHGQSAHSELVVLRSNAEHKIVLALARTSLALESALAARALVEEILSKSDGGIERIRSWNVLTRVCTG